MPYVEIKILSGATRDQKQALVRDVTASLVGNLGKKPEHIHIVIHEVNDDNWGYAGQLTSDWRATQADGGAVANERA